MTPGALSRHSLLATRHYFVVAGGLALLAAAPRPTAADPPAAPAAAARPADPGEVDDVLDLLYLEPTRPYLFRLHVTIDGKPYSVRWAEQVLKIFKFLDKANDGYLTKEEVALAPSPQQMAQMFHGTPWATTAFNDDSAFREMDVDEDGKVTPVEFLNYYRRSAGGPAQLVGASGAGLAANALTDTLFKILDTDKDGKLSKKELLAAEKVLHKYDLNDDEIITASEILQTPAAFAPNGPVLVMQAPAAARPTPLNDSPFLLIPREEAPKRLTQRLAVAKDLVARYDKDKNGKLSPEEIGLPKDVFDRFDADKDGEWNEMEVVRWIVFGPDLEATVHLGRVGEHDSLLDVGAPATASGLAVHKAAVNAASLGFSDALLSLIRAPQAADAGGLTETIFQGYDQQFQAVDKEDKRYITRQQTADGGNPMLYQAFPIIDRDGDGKVTEEELRAWVALAAESAGCVPTISVADNGRALFELLDANNDGRLSLRELRGAWNRLAPYVHGGAGVLSRDDIPQQYQLTLVQSEVDASVFQQQMLAQPQVAQPPPQPPRIERGPLWFRKMDVNGDGDVSPREFLGSLEDFKRIDTDGDGLISVEEAEAFDAMMRAKKGDK
ncbi:MAG TPA: EF-hand domain-containing protein [Gemmataceae bacterium]|nr:EF-hand domain-containing protein [Gemmataceae bacterium]